MSEGLTGGSGVSAMANGSEEHLPEAVSERQGVSPALNVVNSDDLDDREGAENGRPPTSAEIDAVIAAAMASAPPAPSSQDAGSDTTHRSITPLMTNLLPAAVGADGRVNLFVGNLPYRVRWQDLKDLFRKAGTVLRADVSLGPDNRSRGYGTVLMGSREDAARAIDRFNGFTWQTRTLEVRPDRLPPEYEPQVQPVHPHPHSMPRAPMFPYIGSNGHFGGPGHAHGGPGMGPGWHPSNHRPHMNHFPGGPSHPMGGIMSHPGMSLSPHPQHMHIGGSAPGHIHGHGPGPGQSHSPAHFHANGMGPHAPHHGSSPSSGPLGFGQLGASPLAGSLTTGNDNSSRPGSSLSDPRGVSPQPSQLTLPSAPSPAVVLGSGSRPASSLDHRTVSPVDATRPPPSVAHPPTGSSVPASHMSGQHGHQLAPAPSLDFASRPHPDHGHVPHLEGLGHKSAILGPPSTLHDRVVFVSNLPLSLHWQELKDLLRPAGVIIRADVLSNGEGTSRGYGTALFASEEGASRAVEMFNGRELSGRPMRVYLERDSHHHDAARRSSHSQTEASAGTSENVSGRASEQGEQSATVVESSTATPSQPKPALASRVPWQLNLSNQSTPQRGPAHGFETTPHFRSAFPARNGDTTPHFRNGPHPGPIAMPPWPALDSPNPLLSPLQTRGLPPMTPSMPGFVFNQQYPETPPLPHHFGGPFSPGIPVTSPGGFSYSPFMNAAPGAPVIRSTAQTGGSAQLGTPTTQAFPHNPIRGAGPPGAPIGQHDYFPSTEPSNGQPTMTPPPLGSRTTSQSVLNARDRLAPSAPGSGELNGLTASMALHTVNDQQSTPPSPTYGKRSTNRPHPGVEHSQLVEEDTGKAGVESGESARQGRFSLDDQRPNLEVEGSTERRASFGDSRKQTYKA